MQGLQLKALAKHSANAPSPLLCAEKDAPRNPNSYARDHLSQLTLKNPAKIQQKLIQIVNSLLGEDVPPDQPLMEVGLDSLGMYAEMHHEFHASLKQRQL